MDSLSSTEFRKSYARLTGPVLVTVHGHVIGEWSPRLGTAPEVTSGPGYGNSTVGEVGPRRPQPAVRAVKP